MRGGGGGRDKRIRKKEQKGKLLYAFVKYLFVFSVAAAENPSSDRPRQNLAFDFCASWPSGLLIEPTIEDAGKNPFCIRQSYVSKCPARAGATREVRRNFLRNGTVLKHLADNTVVILRPNGVIVTCTDFDKPRSRESTADAVVVHRTTVKSTYTKMRVSQRVGQENSFGQIATIPL